MCKKYDKEHVIFLAKAWMTKHKKSVVLFRGGSGKYNYTEKEFAAKNNIKAIETFEYKTHE